MSKIGFSSNPSNGASHTWRSRRRFNYSSSKGGWQAKGATPPTPTAPTLNASTDLQDMNDATGLAARMRGMAVMYNSYSDFPTEAYTGTFAYTRDTNELYVWTGDNPVAPFLWGGDRVVVAGGNIDGSGNATNRMDYYNITSPENASDFGDLLTISRNISAVGNTSRIVFGPTDSGSLASTTNVLQYVTPSTLDNASDFGDRTVTYSGCSTTSDGTYGIFAGGSGVTGGGAPYSTDVIDYITIATPSNALDFGDLTSSVDDGAASGVISNGTYGILSKPQSDFANYITIATPANATLLTMTASTSGNNAVFSDDTYGVIQGGQTIEYFNIGTTITVTDFGDTSEGQSHSSGASNGTYGTINGGYRFFSGPPAYNNFYNTIDRVTIATPSSATDFGDLTGVIWYSGAGSGNAA